MTRDALKVIEEWLQRENRYPLVIYGARQVGKTYMIENYFNNSEYDFFEFNFLEDTESANIFNTSNNIVDTLKDFALKLNINVDSPNTVIFFDEIQETKTLFQGLKFLSIKFPQIKIICAGSLLGVWLNKLSFSFPVGYIEEFTMYPISFVEFLKVTNNERYIPSIEECYKNNKPMPEVIHNTLIGLYKNYLILGGMPEIVQNYLTNNCELLKTDFRILEKIIKTYEKDMAKYNDDVKDKIRTKRIYDVIVPQLEKTNPKFQYAKIDKNDNRKSDYITALDWLLSANIIYKCNQVTNPSYPLKFYEDDTSYKLFLNDTGILSTKSGINRGDIKMDGDYPFKGVLTENYVANELTQLGFPLLYFSKKNINNNGMEIDFIIQLENDVIPIEVKSSSHTQAKSLKAFMNEYNSPYAIRISSKNFCIEQKIKSVPLYAIFCIKNNINNHEIKTNNK